MMSTTKRKNKNKDVQNGIRIAERLNEQGLFQRGMAKRSITLTPRERAALNELKQGLSLVLRTERNSPSDRKTMFFPLTFDVA